MKLTSSLDDLFELANMGEQDQDAIKKRAKEYAASHVVLFSNQKEGDDLRSAFVFVGPNNTHQNPSDYEGRTLFDSPTSGYCAEAYTSVDQE